MRSMEVLRMRAQWIGERRNPQRLQFLLARGFHLHQDVPCHNLRRAKALAHVLEHYPVVINEDDLLVGKLSIEPLTDTEEIEFESCRAGFAREQRGLRYGSGGTGGHRTVDFETLLALGVNGILEQVAEQLSALDYSRPNDAEAAVFYHACRVTLSALLRFAERYSVHALELHAAEEDDDRKVELKRIAAALAHVPANPPRDFFEALQSVWLVQLALSFDDISCTGHPDRYLWPFYQQGMADGTLTRDGALTLIAELYLRSNEVFNDWPETIMVGGTAVDGTPVVNDLTCLFIEAIETVGLVNPNVALCYRSDTPRDLLELCLGKLAHGFSHPALYNDTVITSGLVDAGLAPEDARYYQNSTCVEITPVGTSNIQVVAAVVSPVKALECLLNDGQPMMTDTRSRRSAVIPADCPHVDLRSLSSFEQFYETYKQTLHTLIDASLRMAVDEEYRRATYGSCPLVACFVRDCIERGKDVAAGGARYNYCGVNVSGFATAVDSLCAIREAVYERKTVDLPNLAQALQRNFSEDESLRQFLLNECPKYGNDVDEVDQMARDLYDFIRHELRPYRTKLGGAFHLGCFSGWGGQLDGKRVSASVSDGAFAAATPDGRLAGMPLSENIGPAPGADVAGLTAMVNSVTTMDHRYGLGGISVNWRLNPGMLKNAESRSKILDLIRVFMDKGGFELQINVVDSATLRAAKEHPESYRNLTVRIAGYSEYFCNVGATQQDAIIARTQYEEAS